MTIGIVDALLSLRPGAEWAINGDTYAGLNWLDTKQTKPTEAEVSAEIAKLSDDAPLVACKAEAKSRIAASDWAVLPDVPLTNKTEFEQYRAALRALILNPVKNPVWPTEPQPVWATN